MQPRTLTNQTPGTEYISTQPQLDPTALALSRSIRKVESNGNYNAIGDNGRSWGAYQWNGDNYQQWAKQYGLDPEDTSQTNQDHLAYLRIKDMLDQGSAPSEVAARWNGAKMVNGKYVAINPAYPEKVKNAYAEAAGQMQQDKSSSNFVNPPPVTPSPIPQDTSASDNTQKPGFMQSIAQGIAQPFLQGARFPLGLLQMGVGKLTGSEKDVQRGADLAGTSPVDFGPFGKVNAAGYDASGKPLSTAGAVGQAVGAGMQIAPWFVGAGEVGNLADKAGASTVGGLIKSGAKTGATLGGIAGAGGAIQQGSETGTSAIQTGNSAIIQGVTGAATGGLLGGAIAGLGGVVGKLAGKVNTQALVNDAIDSVSPDLTGKRLSGAYEAAAKRGDYVGGASPGIDPRSAKIGTELSDIGLKPSDPRGNLVKLSRAMNETEYQITPFNNYGVSPGVKRVLINELDALNSQIPREFQRIGDTKGAFSDVVEFGKQIASQAQDTIGGYRDARTAFDAQAKLQYPTAFNENGTVNLKTPAGTAIKLVRDTMNDNLYQIAPSNSHLQELIKREADIYTAIHNIAPKVAKINGVSGFQLTMKNNPTLAKLFNMGRAALPYAIGAGGAGLIGHLVNSQSTPSGQ